MQVRGSAYEARFSARCVPAGDNLSMSCPRGENYYPYLCRSDRISAIIHTHEVELPSLFGTCKASIWSLWSLILSAIAHQFGVVSPLSTLPVVHVVWDE
jgi:hypothetical protein